jgi:hypothetical protein
MLIRSLPEKWKYLYIFEENSGYKLISNCLYFMLFFVDRCVMIDYEIMTGRIPSKGDRSIATPIYIYIHHNGRTTEELRYTFMLRKECQLGIPEF